MLVGCASVPAPVVAPKVLPLTALRLYETGVGYFERSGVLPGADALQSLPVPAGHLDDALKTLVVLTPGGKAQIGGFEFGSSLSRGMARAMAGLSLDGEAPVTYEALLTSLQGSVVAVRTIKGTVTGRLVHVETVAPEGPKLEAGSKKSIPANPEGPRVRLTLLAENAEVLRIEGASIESVRPTDHVQAARLDAALESLLAQGGQSRHALRLLGAAGAPLTLGYIAETPVWRSTYRLVIPREGKPTLQGWALLHNDTDEPWRDVHVELVNGQPDSFLFPLAAPRYAKRELIAPQNELSTVPQLMGRTVDTLWGDNIGESFGAGGLGLSGVGEGGGGGRGEGIGLGSIGTIGHGAGAGSPSGSSLLAVGDLASFSKAKGTEAGALFVYAMPGAVALRAHASALVPFLQQPIDVEPIAWVDPRASSVRSAVRFVNDTTQTLPAGPIAFFAEGRFAGESGLDRLKPGERRFITHGIDLDVDASASVSNLTDKVQRLTFSQGNLIEHYLRTTDTTWHVENRSGLPRAVYVTLGIGRNATVTGADSVDYDTQSARPLIVFRMGPRKTVERKVKTVEGLSRSFGRDDRPAAKRLVELGALQDLPAGERSIANEAATRQKEVEDTRAELATAREEMTRIEKDLMRYRDDAKAVGEKGGGAQPLVTRIVTAEDKVGALRKRIDGLEKDLTKRNEAVRLVLARLHE